MVRNDLIPLFSRCYFCVFDLDFILIAHKANKTNYRITYTTACYLIKLMFTLYKRPFMSKTI